MTTVSNVHAKPVQHSAPPPERTPPKPAEQKPEVRKAPPPERGRKVDERA
ncbi:MAG: hypothetical protein HY053_03820 [Proteobacteria bacterium]|nr:hypothetical protein [Pseudomonadota bacterium]